MDSILQPGDMAPAFELQDQNGDFVGLSDYRDDYVVVWWIPSTMASMTPACCDHIARGFGEHAEETGLNVIGISFDTPAEMKEFARRSSTTFSLLSDVTKETGKAYGVYRGDDDEWNCFPKKRAFLVDPDGRIAKVYMNIDPDLFVHEVLDDLAAVTPKRGGLLGRALAALKG